MMKWYDIRIWKWATITLVVGLALVSVLGCSTPRAVTTQTFITDKQSEKKFDSLFTTRLSYAFEQWQHIQKRETEKATKDSSYVKDSTATRSWYRDWETDRKSTRLNSSHSAKSRMPSSA